MRKLLLALACIAALPSFFFAQKPATPPRLVVGIVVDQMRYDCLYRYRHEFGPDGFNRLLREGFSCENTHYNYVPTYTAPGHAAIYTGTVPAVNGITSNEWWDADWGKHRYVTTDTSVRTVGGTGRVGQHSPSVLRSSTITDELKLSNNMRPKTVGICLKDRGAILPAGHFPDACFWFDDASGDWISSTYYFENQRLPTWVEDFNRQDLPQAYLKKGWSRMPGKPFDQFFAGNNTFEIHFKNDRSGGQMPYDLAALQRGEGAGVGILRATPWGNCMTADFAMQAIEKMELGKDEVPDFLALSFSCTDYVAHQFGPHSEEMEDTYLRLDSTLAEFFKFLDKTVGPGQTLVFLTADHGGAEVPRQLDTLGSEAEVFFQKALLGELNGLLRGQLGEFKGSLFHEISSQQIWLNHTKLDSLEADEYEVSDLIINYLRTRHGIRDAFTQEQLMGLPADYPFAPELRRGLYPKRSGDILFTLEPGWHGDDRFFKSAGTTHGSPYAYDTHVPLLWFGWRVRPGETSVPVSPTDVAPTLAAWLRIQEPNGCLGKVISEVKLQN